MSAEVTNLSELIDAMDEAAVDNERISVAEVMEAIGSRSLGPLLLLAGLITMAPVIGDIPGVPTIMAIFIVLVAGQLMFKAKHLWLPKWLLKRSISHEKLDKMLNWSRKPARFVDRHTHPRLSRFVEGNGQYLIAGMSILIALMMPFMEVVPLTANFAGLALAAFGLALISRDGVLALSALVVVGLLTGFLGYKLL